MTSPARRHFLQKQAALQKTDAAEVDLSALPVYQRLLYSLKQDKQVLKAISSIKDKCIAKAEMLPKYADWITGVMQAENPAADDEVFTTALLWMIDTGALTDAVPIAVFAVKNGMEGPDDFQRTLSCTLFEQFAEQIQAGFNIDAEAVDTLIKKAEEKNSSGTHVVDMPDVVRAKFFKAAGIWQMEFGNKDRAAVLLEKAVGYDPKVGAKTLLKELRKSS